MKWPSETQIYKLISYKSTAETPRESDEEKCPICLDSFEDDNDIFVCHNIHKYHLSCISAFINRKLRNMDWEEILYPTFKCPLSNIEYTCDELASISDHIVFSDETTDYIHFRKPNSDTIYQTFSVDENELYGLVKKTREFENAMYHYHYAGPLRNEVLTKIEKYKDGNLEWFSEHVGVRNQEIKTSSTHYRDGSEHSKVTYEGPRGFERKVKKEFFSARVMQFYEGPKYHEKLVRAEFEATAQTPFQVQEFEGEKGHECLVKTFDPSTNKTCFFQGPKGHERRKRCEYPDKVEYYEGESRREEIVRTRRKRTAT